MNCAVQFMAGAPGSQRAWSLASKLTVRRQVGLEVCLEATTVPQVRWNRWQVQQEKGSTKRQATNSRGDSVVDLGVRLTRELVKREAPDPSHRLCYPGVCCGAGDPALRGEGLCLSRLGTRSCVDLFLLAHIPHRPPLMSHSDGFNHPTFDLQLLGPCRNLRLRRVGVI